MKLFLISIISTLLFNVGYANTFMDREVVIMFEKLPATAQKFLNKHFPQQPILSIVKDADGLEVDYSIYYEDGTEVKFDRKGNWESVEHEYSSIPESVLPEQILNMIKSKHPERKVTGITRDLTGRDKGYEVELDNVLELRFDLEGRFVRYDD